jgi:hypothetical protein
MATTTNYGWDTPDDTDLVKDGAAAIRTLGSSVDTTTKALNPSTTEGDIEYRSATANTNTRLGIGTAGQVLQVNSGATAPEWATPSSGGMTLISTTTLSGASVTLSSIPSTYKSLYVFITEAYGTDAVNVQLRFNSDTAANYSWSTITAAGGSVGQEVSNTTNTLVNIIGILTSNTSALYKLNSRIWFHNYTATSAKGFDIATQSRLNGGNRRQEMTVGNYSGGSAISSITILLSSGSFTAGTALLYGVN